MRRLAMAILASSFAVCSMGAAMAADAITEPPVAPAPVKGTAPLYIWSGPYGGVFADYDWGHTDGLSGKDVDGFGGGAFAGYNWEANNYVFGVETDLGYSGADAAVAGLKADRGLFGSVRARVGYDLNPFMLYATGGVAAANTKLDDGASSDTKTSIGWTAGAGAEAAINKKVTARIEYRYSDYGSKTYNLSNGPVSAGFDEQSVRAGIGIKF